MKDLFKKTGNLMIGILFLAFIFSFSGAIAAASQIGTNTRPALCDRLSSIVRIFLGCSPAETPPPATDMCPNVPGNQTSTPCGDEQCAAQGGIWNGFSCTAPQPVPPSPENGRNLDFCERYLSSSRISPPPECVPFVRLTYPNGGETFTAGDIIQITWESNRANRCSLGHSLGEGTLDWIATDLPGTQKSFAWTVKSWGSTFQSQQQKIYILCNSIVPTTQLSDYSDAFFTVNPVDVCPSVPGTQEAGPCADQVCSEQGGMWNGASCDLPFVRITHPNGGEMLKAGVATEITWEARGVASCSIGQTFSQGKGTLKIFATNVDASSGSYTWITTGGGLGFPPANEWIYIVCQNFSGASFEDFSDNTFYVQPSPQCSDGEDNDKDGKVDYPADPNCINGYDDSEASPLVVYDSPGSFGFVHMDEHFFGHFYFDVTDTPILLGPISFTITIAQVATTTEPAQISKLKDVLILGEYPTQILGGPFDLELINGVGKVTFPNPIYLNLGRRSAYFYLRIPSSERNEIDSNTTLTISADLGGDWKARNAISGAQISLEPNSQLVLEPVHVVKSLLPGPRPACYDDVDNDNDGAIDFPVDTGCSSGEDDTETLSEGTGGGAGGSGGSN